MMYDFMLISFGIFIGFVWCAFWCIRRDTANPAPEGKTIIRIDSEEQFERYLNQNGVSFFRSQIVQEELDARRN